MRLLEQTTLALEKGAVKERKVSSRNHDSPRSRERMRLHRAIPVILDRLDLDLSATHFEVPLARLGTGGKQRRMLR